jgi:hypothetical protein
MPSTLQRSLHLPTPASEVSLVSLDYVGSQKGWHIDRVVEWAEEQWCFDLSNRSAHERSELRVWIRCLENPDSARLAGIGEVIESVIGSPLMDRVRAASLETRWRVSSRTIARLRADDEIEGIRAGAIWWISRSSLRAFLERRLVR